LSASLVAVLKPMAPGIPIETKASVSLPTTLSSATSSNGFILSKNFSTSAAVFESAPRSTSSAPRDTTPSTVLIKPDTIPAPMAVYQLASLCFSGPSRGMNTAI